MGSNAGDMVVLDCQQPWTLGIAVVEGGTVTSIIGHGRPA